MELPTINVKITLTTDGGQYVSGEDSSGHFMVVRLDAGGNVIEVRRESKTTDALPLFGGIAALIGGILIVGNYVLPKIVDKIAPEK